MAADTGDVTAAIDASARKLHAILSALARYWP